MIHPIVRKAARVAVAVVLACAVIVTVAIVAAVLDLYFLFS